MLTKWFLGPATEVPVHFGECVDLRAGSLENLAWPDWCPPEAHGHCKDQSNNLGLASPSCDSDRWRTFHHGGQWGRVGKLLLHIPKPLDCQEKTGHREWVPLFSIHFQVYYEVLWGKCSVFWIKYIQLVFIFDFMRFFQTIDDKFVWKTYAFLKWIK